MFLLGPANIKPYFVFITLFFVFGLKCLILVMAIELSRESIHGSITGLILLLSVVTPASYHFLIGRIIDSFGWNYFFTILCGLIMLSAFTAKYCRPD
jgi:sugar phosphate permease